MILEVDAGNTRIKWRVFLDDIVQSRGVVANEDIESWLRKLDQTPLLDKIRMSSVSDRSIVKRIALYSSQRKCLFFEAKSEKETAGVFCGYADPSTMGVDRWMAIVAAYNRFRLPCVIVDAGSAITLDVVDGSGQHLGGYIMPGLEMVQKALLAGTKNVSIKLLDMRHSGCLLPGQSTQQCVVRGQLLMLKSMVESIAESIQDQKMATQIILTGGNGEQLATIFDDLVYFEPELVLDGLKFSVT